jgi:multidrug efflux pump
MNFSAPFVRRPIGTLLMTAGLALAGFAAYFQLPVSPLPQIDIPTISVNASLPGASPDTMASSVATPLERRLGRIAGVTEMTSRSSLSSTNITLQFDYSRNIDGAARDVQAAINASRVDLPSTLRSNPTYRKVDPSAAPILILALTSQTRTPAQTYDAVSNVLQQQLSQVPGVGEVEIGGGSLPAVRVELNPYALASLGVGAEDVRAALSSANANRPKGVVDAGPQRLQIYTNDTGLHASDYRPLIVAYRNGAPVRLGDIASVTDGVEDVHNLGLFNGRPSIVALVTQEPGANIIATVDRIRALLPALRQALPQDVDVNVALDRTNTIRASLFDVEATLLIAVLLVVAVTLLFLKSLRATLIPAIAVLVSLLATLGAMFLLGFSLDNLSLMALVVATGFVVDDAIVVLENTTRHLEAGMGRFEAALYGAREVGFTVLSISVSLVAVFIPILLMSGLVGRLFREFAITLSAAILVSLVISLTTTPMLCAMLLPRAADQRPGRLSRFSESFFNRVHKFYQGVLDWSLDTRPVALAILLAAMVLSAFLYVVIPKGFFPQQDTGLITGAMQADQASSFQIARSRLTRFVNIIRRDPSVQSVVGFTGGSGRGGGGGGFVSVSLKPRGQRHETSEQFIARMTRRFNYVTGASLFLNPVQDVRAGGRAGNATYQYTLTGDNRDQLRDWADELTNELKAQPELTEVSSDQSDHGLEAYVDIDRDMAARLDLSPADIDNTLYDFFGQRQATTIYNAQNQYHVIMEAAPQYAQDPTALQNVFIPVGRQAASNSASPIDATPTIGANNPEVAAATPAIAMNAPSIAKAAPAIAGAAASQASGGSASAAGAGTGSGASSGAQSTVSTNVAAAAPPTRNASQGDALSANVRQMTPLSAIAHWSNSSQPRSVNHQDLGVAATISFNLAPGKSLSDAATAIARAEAAIGMPISMHGSFQGTARVYQQSLGDEPLLILAALVVIYIVLGILYESTIHPLTVLSTLPSAGLGALIALVIFHIEFSVISLIGIFLLIGLVKKNAILIIDFAIEAERGRGLTPRAAIREAALVRFRPIIMTTLAALFAATPLAIGWGEGSELRRPLGVAIIGGLAVSQALTLITTPVIYLYLDRFRRRSIREQRLSRLGNAAAVPAE